MAKSQGYVIWNGAELLLQVNALNLDFIDKLALEVIVESQAPIDTGFLDASAYVNSSSGLNTYDQTWLPGEYLSSKSGRLEFRDKRDDPEPPPKNGAVAGWGAVYAGYVEENTDFIFKALVTVSGRHM